MRHGHAELHRRSSFVSVKPAYMAVMRWRATRITRKSTHIAFHSSGVLSMGKRHMAKKKRKNAAGRRHWRFCVPMRITEKAIEKYGDDLLAHWVYLKHYTRRSGGVVYYGFTDQRYAKFGWGRTKFYDTMNNLVSRGLAKRRKFGWLLAKTSFVIGTHKGKEVFHKCSLPLPRKCDVRYIRDLLRLKLFEMGHAQNLQFIPSAKPEDLYEAGLISLKRCGSLIRQRGGSKAQNPIMGPLGSTAEQLLNCARSGKAPMNTERLMRITGLGRAALFAWKKRARMRRWFLQFNRTFSVPKEMYAGVRLAQDQLERMCKGRFSFGTEIKFHQASMYQLGISYER